MKICRVCGCTDDNCNQCIEVQGKPCYWITAVCENCGTNKEEDEVRISKIWWINGEKYEGIKLLCGQCEDELWVRCDCEALIDVDSYGDDLPMGYEGLYPFCPECAAKNFPMCEECGNLVLSIKQGLCEECFDEKYGEED